APQTGAASTVATVLAGTALGAALTGIVLLPAISPGPLLLGTAAFITFPLFFPRPTAVEEMDEEVLWEDETAFGTLRVTEIVYPGKRQPERRLYQGDEIESGELVRTGAPTFAYIAAGERLLAEIGEAGQSYLFLGGGAYTLPRRVAERDASARITVVELDPEVTRIAARFFGLRPELGITSVHGDARAVASRMPAGSFDRVFLDVYDGTEQVPYHLVTVEGLAVLARLLRPGGVLAVNVIGVAEGEGERRFWSTVRTAREAFASMRLYFHLGRDYPDRQNFLVVASPEPGARLPDTAGAFEEWPEAEWPNLPTTVFRDRFPTADERRAVEAERERSAGPA
ncbi:MAG TPA: fused MFS/spermidine synthase, partial [Longimicrobium sp.]|nr:fused MFS/spermidine synthase [Longimicrobium sp.]